jgi:hypothetical protein
VLIPEDVFRCIVVPKPCFVRCCCCCCLCCCSQIVFRYSAALCIYLIPLLWIYTHLCIRFGCPCERRIQQMQMTLLWAPEDVYKESLCIIYASMHLCIHASMNSCIDAFVHSCIRAFMHSCSGIVSLQVSVFSSFSAVMSCVILCGLNNNHIKYVF